MDLQILDLKLKDLPKNLTIQMPADSSESNIEDMIESLKSQLIYNSRIDEEEKESNVKIDILNKKGDTIELRLSHLQ